MPRHHCLISWFLLSLLLVTGCKQSEPTNEAPVSSAPPKMEEEKKPESSGEEKQWLIQASDLKDKASDYLIIDVRSGEDYEKAHLPGAVHVDLDALKKKSLEDNGNGLNDTEFWSKALGEIGISPETKVVIYSDAAPNAARGSFLLGYQGVENIFILDGGWKKWLEISGETTEEVPKVEPKEFKPSARTDWVISTDEVQDKLEAVTVADSRSVAEYTGTGGKGKRKGHIPGAIRMEWSDLLNEDGTYKSKEELQKLLDEKGFKPEQSVITHCQTGGRASVNFIAFRLAGYPDIKNYYCGWSEWSADEAHPVEKPEVEKTESDKPVEEKKVEAKPEEKKPEPKPEEKKPENDKSEAEKEEN